MMVLRRVSALHSTVHLMGANGGKTEKGVDAASSYFSPRLKTTNWGHQAPRLVVMVTGA